VIQHVPAWLFLGLHVCGALGMCLVIAYGTPTAPVRKIWPALLGCPFCLGVWVGAAWAALLVWRGWLPVLICDAHDVTAFAFTVSLLGFLIACIVGTIERANARLRRGQPSRIFR
jgi:hypothetical protein